MELLLSIVKTSFLQDCLIAIIRKLKVLNFREACCTTDNFKNDKF